MAAYWTPQSMMNQTSARRMNRRTNEVICDFGLTPRGKLRADPCSGPQLCGTNFVQLLPSSPSTPVNFTGYVRPHSTSYCCLGLYEIEPSVPI